MFLLDIAKARQVSLTCAAPAGFHAQPSQCFPLEPVLSFSMASPAVSTVGPLCHLISSSDALCPGRGGVMVRKAEEGVGELILSATVQSLKVEILSITHAMVATEPR